MGVYEILINEVFRNPEQRPHFILASNTHGAYLKTAQHIVHAGQGAIEFAIVPHISGRNYEAGFLDNSVPKFERKPRLSDITTPDDPSYESYKTLRETVAALLLLEPLNVSWRSISYLQTVIRRKLVVNAVINPLTALMGCRNGDLFRNHNSSAYNIMDNICREASAVFKAQAMAESQAWSNSLAMEGIDPNDVVVGRLPEALSSEMLKKEVLRVADSTKHNISSMLSDIRRGRSTEIDFINGYLLNLGTTHRVKMPCSSVLLHLVKLRGAIPLDQIL
jgi:2-dehydropantoate 2-reductase